MKAREVHEHFRSIGPWVDWTKTRDEFLHGDPEAGVKAVACAWIPTMRAIREAAERGANLFVTHEPAFYPGNPDKPLAVKSAAAKRALLDELGMTLLRCHDVWDRVPEHGIPAAWARWLGFPLVATGEADIERLLEKDGHTADDIARGVSFYRVMNVSGHTVDSLARALAARLGELGQEQVMVYGDGARPVERLASGTGAITKLPLMAALGADALLATDDGTNSWDSGLWAVDTATPVLIVNHAVAEKPGMMSMATYLAGVFPDVPACYIDVEMPYRFVTG